MKKKVVIIGGGATGTGIAAEASRQGFEVTLIERGSLGSGTSGSFHGMLHSGARYAVNDPAVAAACYCENQKLRELIPSSIVDTGGLFVAFSDEEVSHADTLMQACRAAGIPTAEISVTEALAQEPSLNKSLKRAIKVPDATIDGQEVLRINKQLAVQAKTPAIFLTNHEVIAINRNGSLINSLSVKNASDNSVQEIRCDYLINAGGVWAGQIAKLAAADLSLIYDKGTMVMLKKQLTNSIINRCRPEADGDLLVPFGGKSIIGTTSQVVDSPNKNQPTKEEVDALIKDGSVITPSIQDTEVLKVYAGVRPLFRETDPKLAGDSRAISRAFRVIDHQDQGISNMISVVGGKVTLYRLMAEQTINLLNSKI